MPGFIDGATKDGFGDCYVLKRTLPSVSVTDQLTRAKGTPSISIKVQSTGAHYNNGVMLVLEEQPL